MKLSTPTRSLLQCAAFGAVGALIVAATSPVTGWLAAVSPQVYAVAASISILLPMVAARWTGMAGATSLSALITAVLTMPFTALGVLIVPAIVLPALAIDLVLGRRPGRGPVRWALAAASGGVVIWAVSFVVIPADAVSSVLIATLLVLRIVGYLAAMALAWALAAGLERAGVRSGTRSAR